MKNQCIAVFLLVFYSAAAAAAPLPAGPYRASCTACYAANGDLKCGGLAGQFSGCADMQGIKHSAILMDYATCEPETINNQVGELVCQRKPPKPTPTLTCSAGSKFTSSVALPCSGSGGGCGDSAPIPHLLTNGSYFLNNTAGSGVNYMCGARVCGGWGVDASRDYDCSATTPSNASGTQRDSHHKFPLFNEDVGNPKADGCYCAVFDCAPCTPQHDHVPAGPFPK